MEKILIKEIINPICYILVGTFLYLVISRVIRRASRIKIKGENIRKKETIINLINNVIKYIIAIIVILMILEVYNVNTGAILASLGVVSLIVGLALQDLVKDFVAGIFIIFDDQYNLGDIVTINGFRGEVVSLGLKSTKLKSYLGDVLVIANGSITEVVNHSALNSRAIVEFDVAYEEDLDHVFEVLKDECALYEKNETSLCGPIQIVGVTDLGNSGVRIRITVETLAEEQFRIERVLRKLIKMRFDKENISIPYQQVVVHNGKRV